MRIRWAAVATVVLPAALVAQRSTSVSQPVTSATQSASLGRITFPSSGSPAAQSAFLRGVLLLHSFEYDDAIVQFREAEREDPGFALAYWGEAMCFNQTLWYNEDIAKARAALARLAPTAAARRAKAPTEREKGYLDAVERLFGDGPKRTRNIAYAERMAALSRANPSDDEAAAFYALALLGTIPEGERDTKISLQAGAIASAILKRNPEHPGAAHYALHAFDDGEHAAMGLEAARIYAKIAPASSHARHMPSHVFLPLGLWDDAAASDESAYAASVDHARRLGLSAAQRDFHALSWLQYEYLQQGRFERARGLLKEVEAAERAPAAAGVAGLHDQHGASGAHVESEIGKGFDATSLKSIGASFRARFVIESGHWEEMRGKQSFDNVDELFALGIASVELGDEARTEAAFDELQRAQSAAPDADNRQLARIMTLEVAGLLQLARHKKADGLGALAAAAKLESERPKPIARPYPIKPAGELYAEGLLASGEATGAIAPFKAVLARTPRRAQALIGLARAYEASGNHEGARKTARELLLVWRQADPGRPELAEAKRLLAQAR